MYQPLRFALSLLALSLTIDVFGQNEPHLGYAYPAGGQRGETVEITLGGRHINKILAVHPSVDGVAVEVIEHVGNFPKEYSTFLRERAQELKDERTGKAEEKKEEEEKKENPPDLPRFDDIRDMTEDELRIISHKYRTRENVQQNLELSERVVLRMTIPPNAPLGLHELRVTTWAGMSNPVRFVISDNPEFNEREPNDLASANPVLTPPFVVNGQCMAGDVDRFRFQARQGQRLVVNVQAREIIPYIADAVPGWFQAVVSLRNERGQEVQFADDYQFHPDPVLLFEVKEAGVYEVEIRDSIFRGREDFVYRIAVGEFPFVTGIFPLGAPEGERQVVQLAGWNLPTQTLKLDNHLKGPAMRRIQLPAKYGVSNEIHYAVDPWPEVMEAAREAAGMAQELKLPVVVNGRISQPGERDYYVFEGKKGQEIVAEVVARRLRSPLDSLLRIIDPDGNVVAFSDDHADPLNRGSLTHHADSYLTATLPVDGRYYVQLADAQAQGGFNHAYRLRLSEPQPDFELTVSPSTIELMANRQFPVNARVVRRDGFDGPIELEWTDGPEGVTLHGAAIPAGASEVTFTVEGSSKRIKEPVAARIVGVARIEDETVRREALPCDAVTQAFIVPHLAPAPELVAVTPRSTRGRAQLAFKETGPISITPGHAVTLHVLRAKRGDESPATLTLAAPNAGFQISNLRPAEPEWFAFDLMLPANAEIPPNGNLVLEMHVEETDKRGKTHRRHRGATPALPYVIVSATALGGNG